jgi:hypothetical protein
LRDYDINPAGIAFSAIYLSYCQIFRTGLLTARYFVNEGEKEKTFRTCNNASPEGVWGRGLIG